MNSNAIPYQPKGSEPAESTPIRIAVQPAVRDDWSPSQLSVPLLRVAADMVFLLAGTMIGGMLGHLFQRTQSFELSPQQLLLGSLIYTGIVLSFLQSDKAYPRVI